MPIDEELLTRAREAAAKIDEAERAAKLARADYHVMIRRMHLAGATFREVGQALGLSHQRVQQIVEAAGGSWWSRTWWSRKVERDTICTFCGRPPSEVAKLLAGPDVHVCDACVARAERVLVGREGGALALAPESSRAACSFCGKRRSAARHVVLSRDANVCSECVATCRAILDDRGGRAS